MHKSISMHLNKMFRTVFATALFVVLGASHVAASEAKVIIKSEAVAADVQANVSEQSELTPYHASYFVTFDRFSGYASMQLKADEEPGQYVYSSVTKPRGIAALMGKIRENSKFSIKGSGVVPSSYYHKSRDRESINYDWENNVANTAADNKKAEIELNGNEFDLLSLQMQIMLDLKNDSLRPSYAVIKDNAVKTYELTYFAEETITVGKKTYKAIKLKQKRKGSSRHTILWMSPELDYTVVKMEQYKGKKLRGTMNITSYKQTS